MSNSNGGGGGTNDNVTVATLLDPEYFSTNTRIDELAVQRLQEGNQDRLQLDYDYPENPFPDWQNSFEYFLGGDYLRHVLHSFLVYSVGYLDASHIGIDLTDGSIGHTIRVSEDATLSIEWHRLNRHFVLLVDYTDSGRFYSTTPRSGYTDTIHGLMRLAERMDYGHGDGSNSSGSMSSDGNGGNDASTFSDIFKSFHGPTGQQMTFLLEKFIQDSITIPIMKKQLRAVLDDEIVKILFDRRHMFYEDGGESNGDHLEIHTRRYKVIYEGDELDIIWNS
jgi:hypothetical protein